MSSTKTALKAIGTLIQAAKYDDAVEQARKLLATDSKNYQAYVTLAQISPLFLVLQTGNETLVKIAD